MPKFLIIGRDDKAGEDKMFGWRLFDDENTELAVSDDDCHRMQAAPRAKELGYLIKDAIDVGTCINLDEEDDRPEIHRLVFWLDKDGLYHWKIIVAGGQKVVAKSPKGFKNLEELKAVIEIICAIKIIIPFEWEDPDEDPANKAKDAEDKSGNKTTDIPGS